MVVDRSVSSGRHDFHVTPFTPAIAIDRTIELASRETTIEGPLRSMVDFLGVRIDAFDRLARPGRYRITA